MDLIAKDDRNRPLPLFREKATVQGTVPDRPGGSTDTYRKTLDFAILNASRGEQKELRQRLLGGTRFAECDLCGQLLPGELLRAAHIKRRSACSEDEKRDIANIALLACVLGCDSLFELGYIAVSETAEIVASEVRTSVALTNHLERLAGRPCSRYTQANSPYFAWHRDNTLLQRGEVETLEAP